MSTASRLDLGTNKDLKNYEIANQKPQKAGKDQPSVKKTNKSAEKAIALIPNSLPIYSQPMVMLASLHDGDIRLFNKVVGAESLDKLVVMKDKAIKLAKLMRTISWYFEVIHPSYIGKRDSHGKPLRDSSGNIIDEGIIDRVARMHLPNSQSNIQIINKTLTMLKQLDVSMTVQDLTQAFNDVFDASAELLGGAKTPEPYIGDSFNSVADENDKALLIAYKRFVAVCAFSDKRPNSAVLNRASALVREQVETINTTQPKNFPMIHAFKEDLKGSVRVLADLDRTTEALDAQRAMDELTVRINWIGMVKDAAEEVRDLSVILPKDGQGNVDAKAATVRLKDLITKFDALFSAHQILTLGNDIQPLLESPSDRNLHAAIEKVLPIMLRIVVNLWNEKLDELRDSTFSITHDVDSMNKKIEEMQNRFGAIVKSAEKKVKCIDENCNEALWRVETDNSVGVAGGPGRSKDNSITDKALMRGSTGATFYAHSDDSAIIQVSKDTAPELHLRIYDSFDGYVPSDYFNQVGAELVWGDKDKKENSWALGGYHRMMIRDTYSYAYPGIQGGGFSGGYAYNAEKWMTALKSTIEYGALDFGGFGNHKVPYTQFMVSGLFGGKVADNHLLYGKLQYNMQKVTVTDSWEDVQDGQTTTGSTETNIFQHRVNWSANYVYFAPRGEIKVGAGWSHSIPGPDAFLFNVGFSSRRDDPGYAWNLDFGGGPSTRFADSLQLAPYTYNVGFGMDFPIASATSKRSRLTLGFGLGIDFDKPTPTSSWADTGMTIFGLFRIHYDVSNKTLPSNY